MQELKMGVASAEEETQAVMKVYSKEDYSVVNRFESKWVLCEGYMINDVWYNSLGDMFWFDVVIISTYANLLPFKSKLLNMWNCLSPSLINNQSG